MHSIGESLPQIKRKMHSLVLTREEFEAFMPTLQDRPTFLVWER
jgi:hypothetical protein